MNYVIEGFEPKKLMEHFEELSAIPRGSGNEQAASDFVAAFARKCKLEVHQDKMGNVVVKKPGSAGCEKLPAVMLQGHLDMVCEKNAATVHDFQTDALKLVVEDGWLHAKGTTLGADNGTAVALMMTILEDATLRHPPLECVFTVLEEVGLEGAAGLDASLLSARTMLNLDSEEEGVATVSCAGGTQVSIELDSWYETDRSDGEALKINVRGLKGGHSGINIEEERGNAILLMGRLLYTVLDGRMSFLMDLNGGNKDNAIPRECEARIFVDDPEELDAALEDVKKEAECIRRELAVLEPELCITVEKVPGGEGLDTEGTAAIVNLLMLAPNGVLNRNVNAGGFVVCSSNLGVVRTVGTNVTFTFLVRSSVKSLQEQVLRKLSRLQDCLDFTDIQYDAGYPGWAYEANSPIREVLCSCYKTLSGKEMKCEAIHAGLECGLFSDKLPGLDAIAIGPDTEHCHTPDERLNLASFGRTYHLIVNVLEKLADQAG